MKKQLLYAFFMLCVGVLHSQTSTFDTDTEGWLVVGDNGGLLTPLHSPTGGNPNGFISAVDQGTDGTWYFAAPQKFLGNKSWSYGNSLRFDLRQTFAQNNPFNDNDVIMEGTNGLVLSFNLPQDPNTTWTSYTVPLTERSGWKKKVLLVNVNPSEQEFRSVLCSIKRIWIRGEYMTGADVGFLDNVILNRTNCTPNISTLNRVICQGQPFTFRGKSYSIAGTYRDTVLFCYPQCDSIYVLNLTLIQAATKSQNVTICEGNTYPIGNKNHTTAGIYIDTLKTIGGCDSIVTTNLTVKKPVTTTQNITICEGDIHKVGDSSYTKTGIYRTILRGVSVCDSTIITNLTVNIRPDIRIDTTVCAGRVIQINNNIYTKEGIYRDTFRRRPPLCDSVVTLTIRYSPLPEINENIIICKNDSVYRRGRLYGSSGVFRDTLKNFSTGCDTIVVTNVAISNLAIQFGNDIELEKGDSVKLEPVITGGNNALKWTWTPIRGLSCSNCPTPISRPDKSVTYILEVRDTIGKCSVKDDVHVTVKACEKVFIPDAFSPNNDGNNDMFIAFGASCAKSIKRMAIFSRGGHLLYNTQNVPLNDPKNGWDGTFQNKNVPNDVYVYLIEIEYGNGDVKTFSGDLTLLR